MNSILIEILLAKPRQRIEGIYVIVQLATEKYNPSLSESSRKIEIGFTILRFFCYEQIGTEMFLMPKKSDPPLVKEKVLYI